MILDNKIGITGGFGLVGKTLRANLNVPVILVSRSELDAQLGANEECIIGSFSDPLVIEKFTSNIKVLIHLATAVGPRSAYEDQFIQNDLIGTINLAKAFFKCNPNGHFVYMSTSGGLYDLEDSGEKVETSNVLPKSIYGSIKLLVEDILKTAKGSHGKVTILRPAAIYGDSFKKNQEFGLIDKLIKSLSGDEKDKVQIFDNLASSRDYLYVEDLVEAIKLVIERKTNSNYEVYNVGTGVETSIGDLINVVNSFVDKKVQVEILPSSNKRTSLIVNSEKIFREIGWSSKTSLRNGILKMYSDLKKRDL